MNRNAVLIFSGMIVYAVFFVVGLLLIFSFSPKTNEPVQTQPFPIIVVHGCEYFKCNTYASYYVYTHKGNCTNHVNNP